MLLISGLGDDTGGGLFTFDGQTVEQVDRLSTTGLHVFGDQLLRILWCASDQGTSSDLLVYDKCGIHRYLRLDSLPDPHDVLWDGTSVVIAATSTNRIVWLSPDGAVVREWHAEGTGDCWHLNSLLLHGGDLYVTAFGRFREPRQWAGTAKDGAGIVFNVRTGEVLLSELTCPHHPRVFDGAWAICNSGCHEVLHIDPTNGIIRHQLRLRSWTRGMAIGDDVFVVGESANRSDPNPTGEAEASIAVIDRQTWTVRDRFTLPCREVYDVIVVPPALVEGVRRGFRTNRQRVIEQDQFALFDQLGMRPRRLWATSDPLHADTCRVTMTATFPTSLLSDGTVEISCTIENRGTALLVFAPPNPVLISYKWLDPDTRSLLAENEGIRTPLPETLVPGTSLRCRATVRTPRQPGMYLLLLTLVQEFVAWFDDLDPSNQCSAFIHITGQRTE